MSNKEVDMGINMYDFNRVNMGRLPLLKTEDEINGAKDVIKRFANQMLAKYYMLLNHDTRYFTLFNFTNGKIDSIKIQQMSNDVIECMQNLNYGIIDISPDENGGGLEIWVKDLETETVYMYILFPYDLGVIEY